MPPLSTLNRARERATDYTSQMRHFRWLGLLLVAGCAAEESDDKGRYASELSDSQGGLQTSADTSVRLSLVDPNAWRRADLTYDPFPSHQPKTIVCDPLGTHETDGAFEVDTSYCNYALLTQELSTDLPAGASMEVLLSHGPLVWTEPAEGHIALALDGQVIWERTVAIPADAWIYQDVVTLQRPVNAGSTWSLHCHNHGANSWRLYDVTWVRSEDASL